MEKGGTPIRPRGGYLEAMLQSSPYAVLAIDGQGMITFANKSASDLLARDMRDLVGKSIVTVYETEEQARETNRKLYLSGGVVHDHESTIKAKTGKTIPVRISAAHMRDSSGNVVGAVGFFESYRPWGAAEAKLKHYCEELEADLQEWKDLGAPVFEPLPGLSVAIVVGRLDGPRFERIRSNILDHIKANKTRAALIDLSASLAGDTEVASQMIKTMRMIQLIGAQCVLVGIETSVAQAVEPLIADIGSLRSFSSLQAGLEAALDIIGFEMVKKS